MLAESSDTAVWGTSPEQHPGWVDAPEPRGWMHGFPSPAPVCPSCEVAEPMRCSVAWVTGGRYSLIWRFECDPCGTTVDIPATNLTGAPE